ncbi:toprim domain-containing protein [Mycoplasma sp. ATU-Cv-508]|uniref:toprim domain-containing protein n=1 Tax=Mycoplasma sp. ATU-Cv-508 TaxID=2048001 RepID=UPI000FDF2C7F
MNALETAQGRQAREYLNGRQIQSAQIEQHQIGYAPSDSDKLYTYLIARQHEPETLNLCGIFNREQKCIFADRITFTLTNNGGKVVGFSARALDKATEPKYLNSSQSPVFEKSKLLFNFHRAEDAIRKSGEAVLVEGFLDVIALEKIGYHNVVALMGTNFSSFQASALGQVGVTLILDGDPAGWTRFKKLSLN